MQGYIDVIVKSWLASGYKIEPALAHKIAVEFAERAFPGHEVVVATHIDADHIHSHFVLNAVNADTGLKYHSNKFTLQDLRHLSDEICQKYGVTTLSKPEIHKQSNGITNGEYRVAMRGESWKMNLINTIDTVMKRAKSKKQFRFYMKQCGYDVKWEDSRKYITYTCPNGRRCRDNKLHEAKYRKENMEYEFEIRRSERSLQAEYAGDTGHTNYGLRPGTQLAGADLAVETSDRYNVRYQGSDRRDNDICTDETVPAKSADDNNQLLEQGKEIQEQTSQNVTAEVSKLDQAAKDLVSQAGRLNEQTLSQLKCSEEQSRSHGFRLLRLVVLIEFLHLISSVALLLWLR
ncbi:Relaxase/Mobilisation nuclease domain-containing protein [Ruminococcus sp. YRD2003]|uniref:relaxase/mobilization nuclease domain-containing protein n=1 Tax=Ruminococcus sp. YRD2003 TaxID=1452313 RepID=UPI0008AF819C|nr:Relaxase/Mobilisation nuclease domain-containing protein [Ruminococcus flavefaciens]